MTVKFWIWTWVDKREMLQLVQIQSANYILSERRQLPQATFSWVFWTAEGKIFLKWRAEVSCCAQAFTRHQKHFGIRGIWPCSRQRVPHRTSPPCVRTLLESLSEGAGLLGGHLSVQHPWLTSHFICLWQSGRRYRCFTAHLGPFAWGLFFRGWLSS